MKALLLDNSKLIHAVLGRTLDTMGFDVSYACNSLEAYKIMADEKFDLIIVDLEICEEYHGRLFDTLWHIASYTNIELLPILNELNENNEKKMKKLGVDDYITKPIFVDSFKELLKIYKQKIEERFVYEEVITFNL
jgi:DNA-binding response OmpR family regulator